MSEENKKTVRIRTVLETEQATGAVDHLTDQLKKLKVDPKLFEQAIKEANVLSHALDIISESLLISLPTAAKLVSKALSLTVAQEKELEKTLKDQAATRSRLNQQRLREGQQAANAERRAIEENARFALQSAKDLIRAHKEVPKALEDQIAGSEKALRRYFAFFESESLKSGQAASRTAEQAAERQAEAARRLVNLRLKAGMEVEDSLLARARATEKSREKLETDLASHRIRESKRVADTLFANEEAQARQAKQHSRDQINDALRLLSVYERLDRRGMQAGGLNATDQGRMNRVASQVSRIFQEQNLYHPQFNPGGTNTRPFDTRGGISTPVPSGGGGIGAGLSAMAGYIGGNSRFGAMLGVGLGAAGAGLGPIAAITAVADIISKVIGTLTDLAKMTLEKWFAYAREMEQTEVGLRTLAKGALSTIPDQVTALAAQFGQTFQQTFENLSKTLSESLMKQLQYLAATTPFNFADVARGGRRLLSAQFGFDQVIPILNNLATVSAAFGGTDENFNRIIDIFAQIKNKGKVERLDLRRLGVNFVPVQTILSDALNDRESNGGIRQKLGIRADENISGEQVADLVRKGKLKSDIFFELFNTEVFSKYKDALKDAEKTVAVSLSNIEDSFLIASQITFEPWYAAIRDFLNFTQDAFLGASGEGLPGILAQLPEVIAYAMGRASNQIQEDGKNLFAAFVKGLIPHDSKDFVQAIMTGGLSAAYNVSPQGLVERGINAVTGGPNYALGQYDAMTAQQQAEYLKQNPGFQSILNQAAAQQRANTVSSLALNPAFARYIEKLQGSGKGDFAGSQFYAPLTKVDQKLADALEASISGKMTEEQRQMLIAFGREVSGRRSQLPASSVRKFETDLKAQRLSEGMTTQSREQRELSRAQAAEDQENEREAKAAEREAERIIQRYRRLRQEVVALTSGGTLPEFKLKFDTERLEQFRSTLERIVKIRAELGLNEALALPDNQVEAGNLLAFYEGVLNLSERIADAKRAEMKISMEIAEELEKRRIPLVSAEVLAAAQYLKYTNERRTAERQLTADLLVEFKKRQDAQTPEGAATNRRQALLEVGLEMSREINQAENDRLKGRLRDALEQGDKETVEELRRAIQSNINQGTPMQKIEAHVAMIRQILEKRFAAEQAPILSTVAAAGQGEPVKPGETPVQYLKRVAAGWTVTSSPGGTHNPGSLHPLGLAIDLRTSDKSPAEQEALLAALRANPNVRLLDERQRPKNPNQKWSGPHFHVEFLGEISGGAPPAQSAAQERVKRRVGRRGQQAPASSPEAGLPVIPADFLDAFFRDPKSEMRRKLTEAYVTQPGRDERHAGIEADILSNPLFLSTAREAARLSAVAKFRASLPQASIGRAANLETAKLSYARARAGGEDFQTEQGDLFATSTYTSGTDAITQRDQVQRRLNEALAGGAEYEQRLADLHAAQRYSEITDAVESLKRAQADLNDLRKPEAAFVEALKYEADQQQRVAAMTRENIQLELELADTRRDRTEEYRNTALKAQLEIKNADQEAINSQIRSRVRLADQSVFHSEQAKAKILSHMAEQKSVTESIGDAMVRVYDGVTGAIDKGIDKLTKKMGFFGSILGDILKSITRGLVNKLLLPLFGGNGQGGGQAAASGGFNPLAGLMGVFGGGQAAAGGGGFNPLAGLMNIFGGGNARTPSFAGGGTSPISGLMGMLGGGFLTPSFAGGYPMAGGGNQGGGFGGILMQGLSALMGGGKNTSPGVNQATFGVNLLQTFMRTGKLPYVAGVGPMGLPIFGNAAAPLGGKASLLGGLFGFKGFGSWKAGGGLFGGSFGAALPMLGMGLGSMVGSDRLTSLLGGAAGTLLGMGLMGVPAALGAGGALSGLGFLAPLFSNPVTAIAAAVALPLIFLWGKARQRKRDETTDGANLQSAIDGIFKLRDDVTAGRIEPNQAKDIFEKEILANYIAQVNAYKTKSVRESRLAHQVPDLRALFEKEVGAAITKIQIKKAIDQKLVPEFAVGGIVPGAKGTPQVILAHGGEIIANAQQQTPALMAAASAAGVPGVSSPASASSGGTETPVVNVTFVLGTESQDRIVVDGMNRPAGRRAFAGLVRDTLRYNDTRGKRV